MKLMREADLEPSKYEPDELIETWQQGFAIALNQFLIKKWDNFSRVGSFSIPSIEHDLKAINELQVIQEMNIRFFLLQPDSKHLSYWLFIQDLKTRLQWEVKA